MCGFVAIITPDRDFSESDLNAMRDSLAHRGPDAASSWLDTLDSHKIGLAHRRLAIIDLSDGGLQPMFSQNGEASIVYNGELYNYLALRQELEARGRIFVSQSDTEVLLQAYLEWGTDCLSKLNGMFAFAIFDRRSRELFVARDRLGEKPAYYVELPGGGIAVASEIKALLTHPRVDVRVSRSELGKYLAGASFEFGESTFFDRVHRIDAAHAMLIDNKGAITRSWRYWTPDYDGVAEDLSLSDAAEQLLALLSRSVEGRLQSDVPVGSSLSGGLDSSAIVGLIANHHSAKERQHVFSVVYPSDPTLSEGRYIDAVARRYPVTRHSLEPSAERLMDDWRMMHWHLEAPAKSASVYNQYALMRLAKEAGVTVLLDGQGADELMGGYQYYFGLRQLDLLERNRSGELERESALFWWRLRANAKRYPDARRRFDPKPGYPLETLWERRNEAPRMKWPDSLPGVPVSSKTTHLKRHLASSLLYFHLPNLLHTADRSGMAFGREARFPYLDYELVEWCIGLPDDLLVHDGWMKYILRCATEPVLPKMIRWRVDKVGYAAPQDIWLRGPAREWARDLLFSGPITLEDDFDEQAVEAMWTGYQEGSPANADDLWRLMGVSELLRMADEGPWRARASNQGAIGSAAGRSLSTGVAS